MRILFHENELNYRGTSMALYDYADFNERYLGNESIIVYNNTLETNHHLGIEKFSKRFEVISYENFKEVDQFIQKNNIDLFYAIKNGNPDNINTLECKSCIHNIFKFYEPHGDVYAYVSEWLSEEMTRGASPFVPHMVNFENEITEDLKSQLNIPKKSKVFGYYGGAQSFNIIFAQKAVEEIASKYKDVYFLFMGVDSFIKEKWWKSSKPNIIFLPPSSDIGFKQKFINTCDALLHARERGETFGITVAEFVIKNKPVITFANSPEQAHIQQMENKAYYYQNKKELKNILLDSDLSLSAKDLYQEFLPHAVMDKFSSIFIN